VRHRLNPRREPPTQPRAPRRRDHSALPGHPRPRLLRPQDRGRQDQQSSATRTETTHQRRGLPPTHRRQSTPDIERPGRADGNGSNGQRDRLCTLTAGSSAKPLPDRDQGYAYRPNLVLTRPRTAP
jgi:hypothetical protein